MAARAPALVIPRSLRAEQLKRLSFLCGLPVGGRKDELIARLTAAAAASPVPKPRSSPAVLSIDLGIRNLAFSLLTPVASSTSGSRKPSAKSRKRSEANPAPPSFLSTSPPPITLHAWQRLSLLEVEGPASQSGDDEVALDVDTTGQFAPATLAQTANLFLRETVLKLDPLPTHILIERQRWRSGGAAAIQEWTVRVNTLEAMLHASLRTMRDVGVWKGDVVSIRPERVGQLFLDAAKLGTQEIIEDEEPEEEEEAETSAGKSKKKRSGGRKTSAEAKKLKIGLLGGWLSQGDLIIRPGDVSAGHVLDAYRDASTGTRRSRSKDKGTPVTLGRKLDDLTDSLMQGMAWLRWRENIALLQQENGVEQLLGDNR